MSFIRRALLIAVASLLATTARAEDLIVSAAASLTNAMGDIGKRFEADHPGTKVVFNFAASGSLLQQITQGAPVDVFVSADEQTMDKAASTGQIKPDSRMDVVRNTLVVIVPIASTLKLSSLAELKQPTIQRIALGNPDSVPNGRYARTALQAADLWDTLKDKYVFADNVRQSLAYIARNEVEAGFVFGTDAAIQPDKVKVAFEVPIARPILYPAAIVTQSPHPAVAAEFIRFLRSDGAFQILQRYGFARP